MRRIRYENGSLDAIDARILRLLAENARTSNAELSRLIGLSAPSIAERVKRLEEVGVIRGYAARIDPEALGLPIAAWLRIRPLPGELGRVVAILKEIPEVVQCDRITGDDCFLARVHVASVADLEALIDKLIAFSMTNTSIVQSSPVEGRLPAFSAVG